MSPSSAAPAGTNNYLPLLPPPPRSLLPGCTLAKKVPNPTPKRVARRFGRPPPPPRLRVLSTPLHKDRSSILARNQARLSLRLCRQPAIQPGRRRLL